MKGHTSYLTFATLLPRVVRQEADPTLEREKDLEKRKLAGQERAKERRAQREAEEKVNEVEAATSATPSTDAVVESKEPLSLKL
jgi:DNA-binding transcriptional regulator GbsR (MarR family)